jgi:hypothetical protein
MGDARTIHQGMNHLFTRQFVQRDLSTITFSLVESLTCTLKNEAGSSVGSYTYTTGGGFSAGIRHLGSSEFEIEITKAVSATLPVGKIFAEYVLVVTNPAFTIDGDQTEEFHEHLLQVI